MPSREPPPTTLRIDGRKIPYRRAGPRFSVEVTTFTAEPRDISRPFSGLPVNLPKIRDLRVRINITSTRGLDGAEISDFEVEGPARHQARLERIARLYLDEFKTVHGERTR